MILAIETDADNRISLTPRTATGILGLSSLAVGGFAGHPGILYGIEQGN